MTQWWLKFRDVLFDEHLWQSIGWTCFKSILIIIIGKLILSITSKIIIKIVPAETKYKRIHQLDQRRVKTIAMLVKHILMYTGNFIIMLMVLAQFGVELAPLLAGAGVVGLAIGFGAQNFVKDVIAGFFIIFEDQFAVGDQVQIGAYKGTVEEIGLRITKLKSWKGELYIIPNGIITQVTNHSIFNSIAVVDVLVPNIIPLDAALEQINYYLTTTIIQIESLIKPAEYHGVHVVNEHGTIIRIIAECKPNQQHEVQLIIFEQVRIILDGMRFKNG